MTRACSTAVVAVMAMALLTLGACTHDGLAGSDSHRLEPRSGATITMPSTQPHWVQSKELQGVMQRISGLHGAVPSSQLPQDVESPAGRETAEALEAAAALGQALAETSLKIPAAVRDRPMADADRRAFASVAQTLHDQAEQLHVAAKARQVERMQGLMDDINATCLSCHSRFRDFAGEMDFRKAGGASAFDRVAAKR